MAGYEPRETIKEFLQSKGSVGLLALLYERPMTYSEIESEIEITSSTITNRRDDAVNVGLLTIDVASDEHGTKKVYMLTDMGEFLADKMAREGVFANYRKMRTLQELVEEQTGDVISWVHENPSQVLEFPEADEGIIDLSEQDSTADTDSVSDVVKRHTTKEGSDADSGSEDEESEQEQGSTDDEEGFERPPRPTESAPDVLDRETEGKIQGTLTDLAAEEQSQEQSSDDGSDS